MTTALSPMAFRAPNDEASATYLLCALRGGLYGLEALAVNEVMPLPEVTSIGESPSHIEGVVDVRGKLIPVFDLAAAFGLEARAPRLSDALVVLEQNGEVAAFAIDEVCDVQTIGAAAIEKPLDAPVNALVAGLAKTEDGIVQLLRTAFFFAEAHAATAMEARSNSTVLEGEIEAVRANRFLWLTDEERAVFQSRAHALRRPLESGSTENQTAALAVVQLSGEFFGFNVSLVREFAPLRHWTPVPFAPAPVMGLINLRGEILPLVDLRPLLSLPIRNEEGGASSHVVMVESEDVRVAIRVDSIIDIFHATQAVAEETSGGAGRENLQGTIPYRGKMLAILDVARLLDAVRQ
ncbi:MAG TPA: chemotaxis protein CheW [Abditibacteriaceae bacterium]|jgi:purine-binding chemotaxis protein CheW